LIVKQYAKLFCLTQSRYEPHRWCNGWCAVFDGNKSKLGSIKYYIIGICRLSLTNKSKDESG